MIDGSSLPLAENIALTRAVVDMAHPQGIGVEAELGHVGAADDYDRFGAMGGGFTDPADVAGFIEDTGVDYLAIAFGTAHGVGKGQPRLKLDLVEEIIETVSLPLVMHGGSGLNDDQFRDAIASGISKINVSTNLVQAATRGMQASAAQDDADLFTIMAAAREGYRLACARTLDLFGASGRA
jgi:ketose-bisphosphate aldolase